eukprot:Gb_23973 [translate_table: standard]
MIKGSPKQSSFLTGVKGSGNLVTLHGFAFAFMVPKWEARGQVASHQHIQHLSKAVFGPYCWNRLGDDTDSADCSQEKETRNINNYYRTAKFEVWNRSAEVLYGWKDSEVLGQNVMELLVDEREYGVAEQILRRLRMGESWAGQFLLKKKSGEMFTAMVTETPLYENGEIVGVITVSSDSVVSKNGNSSRVSGFNTLHNQDFDYTPPGIHRLNKPKLEWQQPLHIASTVSNLATKVLSRFRIGETTGDDYAADIHSEGLEQESAQPECLARLASKVSSRLPSLETNSSPASASHPETESGPARAPQSANIATKVLLKLRGGENHTDISTRGGSNVTSDRGNTNANISTNRASKMLSKLLPGESNNNLHITSRSSAQSDQGSGHGNPSPNLASKVLSRILPGEVSNDSEASTGGATGEQGNACTSSSTLASKVLLRMRMSESSTPSAGNDSGSVSEENTHRNTDLAHNEFRQISRSTPNSPRGSPKAGSRPFRTIVSLTDSNQNRELDEKGLDKKFGCKVSPEGGSGGESDGKSSGIGKNIGARAESWIAKKRMNWPWTGHDDDSRKHRPRITWPWLGSEQDEKEHEQPKEDRLHDKNCTGSLAQRDAVVVEAPGSWNSNNSDSSTCSHARGELELDSVADCEIVWEDLILGEPIGEAL